MIWTLQSLFGQFFDATVGQMLTALGGPRPGNQSSPWNAAPPRLALPPVPGPGESTGVGASPPPAVAAWQSAGSSVTVAVERQEGRTLSPRDLDDDEIKLVKYALVSIRPCHEKVLTGGVILVTTPMTAASFSSWIVALYLQSEEYRSAVAQDRGNAVAHADKKYLRVSYGVLRRYPREPKSGCGQGKLNALKGIRNALLGLRPPPPAKPAPPPPAPRREATAAAEVSPAAKPAVPSPRRRPRPQASAPAPAEPPRPETPRPARRRPGPPRRRPR